MFARKLQNRSGSTSVQLIQKERGRYRVIQTVGTSKDPDEIDQLWQQARLGAKKIVETYSHLWQIEKVSRISKTDLRIRPIYHYRRRRIEAHLCTAFAAYAVYKELEWQLKKKH